MSIVRVPISGGSAQFELPPGFEFMSGRTYTLTKDGQKLRGLETRWKTPTGVKSSMHVFEMDEPVAKYLVQAAKDVQLHVAMGVKENGGHELTRNQRRLLLKGM